jgi:hypothetical protein
LGLNRDPLEEFSLNNNNNSLEATTTTATQNVQTISLEQRKKPTEEDFEEIKLISNCAYGAV